MIAFDFDQEFLNKVNAAIAKPDSASRTIAFYELLRDKETKTSQKLYIKTLMNTQYGAFEEQPNLCECYNPKRIEEITRMGCEIVDRVSAAANRSYTIDKDTIMESFFDLEKMYPGVVSCVTGYSTPQEIANAEYQANREENRYLRILCAEQVYRLKKKESPEGIMADPEDLMMLRYHEKMKEFLDNERAVNDY